MSTIQEEYKTSGQFSRDFLEDVELKIRFVEKILAIEEDD